MHWSWKKAGLLWLALVVTAGAQEREAPLVAPEPYAPTSDYEPRTVEGYTLVVHKDLCGDPPGRHAATGEKVLRLLEHQLYAINRRLPKEAVQKLQQVKIWVEYNEPHHACMAYHPDRGWLVRHGMNPEKARCVELANSENFLTWCTAQPWMVLHELAHAYHDQFLEGGFNHAELRAAHEQAKKAKSYESVLHIHGKMQRHYALTNPMEYFAEATEAYFGTNDFFPFVRAELKEHDPRLFALLGKLWGDAP